jgi:hypothetical protein
MVGVVAAKSKAPLRQLYSRLLRQLAVSEQVRAV